jgi:DNA-directed RNA polymerase subunit RPC12/RpoP
MSEDRERIQLRCSNCNWELGSFPEEEPVDTELICPHCGAIVKPPGPVERLATEVKKAVEKLTGRDANESHE